MDHDSAKLMPTKDTFYFFEVVHIKVEDTLFCVPKNGLNLPGTTFSDMFSIPPPAKENDDTSKFAEGSHEHNPIILPVSKKAFRSFLCVLYSLPRCGGPTLPTVVDEWIDVLDLATMWYFLKIRNEAIDAITNFKPPLSPSQHILFGKKYSITKWVKTGYTDLLSLDEPLDHIDLLQSGVESCSLLQLFAIREQVMRIQLSVAREFTDGYTNIFQCQRCFQRANCRQTLCATCSLAENFGPNEYATLSRAIAPHEILTRFKDELEGLEMAEAAFAVIDS